MTIVKTYIDDEGHTVRVYADGSKRWHKNGLRHRDGDKPAIAWAGGSKYWYKNGKLHRDGDKPAIVDADGTKQWFKNGEPHRDGDKPAIVWENGTKYWHKNGKLHRENNPCYIGTTKTVFILNNGRNLVEKEYWVRLLLLEY